MYNEKLKRDYTIIEEHDACGIDFMPIWIIKDLTI